MSDNEALPETRFARSGSVNIAYQVMGEGPIDLVMVPGTVSHIEMMHEIPGHTAFLRRLARFARVTTFDKRGQGLSDRMEGAPTLEERSDDVRAVRDAVGIQRAAVMGISEGSMMSVFFAAAHPDRVSHLLIYGGMPRQAKSEDFPIGFAPESARMFKGWGTGSFIINFAAPSWQGKPELEKIAAKFERQSCSPGNLKAYVTMNYELDVRHILPSLRVPTLVLHRELDTLCPLPLGRYYAEHIPGARLIVYPGGGHWPPSEHEDWETICDDIGEFITGHRPTHEPDRVLATVLFTDIVGSTEKAAALGDQRWHAVLESHNTAVRQAIQRFRGREVDTLGDGFLATFDGPARGVQCARSIVEGVRRLGLEVRCGLHTGECEVIGARVGGIAVHIGARVTALAGASEILVSSTVKDLVAGSGLRFADCGPKALKGVPGEWRIFRLE